jgi:hypothetical protein
MQAEVTQVIGYKMLQQRLAALVAKKDFITNQNVSGTKLASGNFSHELFRRRETSPRH